MARAPRRSEESLAGISLRGTIWECGSSSRRSVNDGQTENVKQRRIHTGDTSRIEFRWPAQVRQCRRPDTYVAERVLLVRSAQASSGESHY
jgi:hypothetical protein